MSWGTPATVAPTATAYNVICEAPNCGVMALLNVVTPHGQEAKACCFHAAQDCRVVSAIDGAPYSDEARDLLLKAWEASKPILEAAKNSEMELRKAVAAYVFRDPKEGVNNHDLGGGAVLKMGRKVNYNIAASNEEVDRVEDEAAKVGNEGSFLFERIITWTANFSKSEYNKLEDSNPTHKAIKALVDKLIVTKDGAPTLEIKQPKATLNG